MGTREFEFSRRGRPDVHCDNCGHVEAENARLMKVQSDEAEGYAFMKMEIEQYKLRNSEMRTALEIAKPSTIHVLSGHVYGADGKLAKFVDGCARCQIERILEVK